MRRENELRFGNAGVFQNFRGVAMREEVVGAEVLVDFDEVQVAARIFAGTGGAGLAIADYVL